MRIEHTLPPNLIHHRAVRVLVIGAGGTGSAIVMGLPYLDQAMRVWGHTHGLDVTMMDADTGKVLQSYPISAGVDANDFDPATGMLFVSTREGMLHIYHEDSPDKLSEVETVKTQYGAKTLQVDPKTHNVFLTTSDFNPPAAPTEKQPHPAATPKPGNFRVLVYGR